MIKKLSISNFRNHNQSRCTVADGCSNIIITGPNGSGKTAILEAISVFSPGAGLRGGAMVEIAKFGTSGFSVGMELSDDTKLDAVWNGDAHRKIRIDNDSAPLSDLPSVLPLAWLTPKEDRVFVESAGDRRAFFDRLISTFDTKHAGRIGRLSKLLSERGFILKNGADDNWLCPIELNIAQVSASITASRLRYAAELNYILGLNKSQITNFESQITLVGWFESRVQSGMSVSDIEKEYIKYLSDNRELVSDKMVVDGVHKSDFGMFSNKLNVPVQFASTGQQKMVILSLIMTHAMLINSKTGKTPIILLDEAVAHLDASARMAFFNSLGESCAQVWATGIDKSVFENVPNACFISCADGATKCNIES